MNMNASDPAFPKFLSDSVLGSRFVSYTGHGDDGRVKAPDINPGLRFQTPRNNESKKITYHTCDNILICAVYRGQGLLANVQMTIEHDPLPRGQRQCPVPSPRLLFLEHPGRADMIQYTRENGSRRVLET